MSWDDFDAFCQVVDHGGFTAAARATERPKSSLSASVARLETLIGTRLLERTTRRLRLTEAGESLYREIAPPVAQLREFTAEAISSNAHVQGTLRIAAPYEFAAHHLTSVACVMMERHSMLKIDLDVEHSRVPLFERHYDIVFSAMEHRFAPATVVTRRVYSLKRGLFAAPSLMNRHPGFFTPQDLESMPLLAGGEDTHWDFKGPEGGLQIEVRNPRVRSGNASMRLHAAIAGLGVLRVTATFCAAAVARGQLLRLLPEWECAPLRIYALLPGRRLIPAKVRAFLDELEAQGSAG